ncbi:MAG TPA: SMC-Scp complex subunit ScpB [Nevskia sp.]|nr:SMC-Scp complex subunit ScpB [Nevskia sp.]
MSDTPEHDSGDEAAGNKKPAGGRPEASAAATPGAQEKTAAGHEAAAEAPGEGEAAVEAAAEEPVAAAAAEVAAEEEGAEPVPAENYGHRLELILEALLLAADGPLPIDQMQKLVASEFNLGRKDLRAALERMGQRYAGTACELREIASGWRLQVRAEYGEWISRLWQEKPPKYSRALLETLALIVYRQPITRGEIEDVRGVAVSTNILRTLLERGWVREVGHKEVPGRPALYGTAPQFLDDFNLKSLDQLPSLPEIKDLEQLEAAMARLGQHADVVASVRAEQEAAENPIQMDVGGEDGEAPVPGKEPADEPPLDSHTLH